MTDSTENKDNEKEPEKTGQDLPQEPILSPKNDDELIIEIEQNKTQSVEQTEPANEEKITDYASDELDTSEELEEEITPSETKAQKLARLKKEKKQKHAKKEIPTDSEPKSKSKIGLILIVALFVIVASAAYLFVINPSILAKKFPSLVEKGIVTIETEHAKIDSLTQTVQSETPNAEATDEVVTKEERDSETNTTIPEEKVVETITETLKTQPAATKEVAAPEPAKKERIVTKGKLQTPCWIISYSSISNEAVAIKTVATLSTQGKKCGYYWIPDYVSGGPKLFKVYIGPYSTKEEAASDLPAIKQDVSGAYVAEVK